MNECFKVMLDDGDIEAFPSEATLKRHKRHVRLSSSIKAADRCTTEDELSRWLQQNGVDVSIPTRARGDG